MEKLLDKDLPKKKDTKKRAIILLLCFLLLGGSVIFLLQEKSLRAKQQQPVASAPAKEPDAINRKPKTEPGQTAPLISEVLPGEKLHVNNKTKRLFQFTLPQKQNPLHVQPTYHIGSGNKQILSGENLSRDKNATLLKENTPIVITKNAQEKNDKITPATLVADSFHAMNSKAILSNQDHERKAEAEAIDEKESSKTELKPNNELLSSTATVAKPLAINKNKTTKSNHGFFVSFSAAPDVSSAGTDKTGKLKLTFGAGIGYNFNDKLSLRTGFYSSRKIYSANPKQYHPPASFWLYYPNLEKVKADCRVFEIPLNLSYNFKKSPNRNLFVTMGLSSYLMKEETYNYTYKNAAGQYRNTTRSIYNQNNHFFSVLTLAGGYERNFNKSFSIAIEPYLKIPLTGIGYGKVKLNSVGLQFSANIRPFAKKGEIKKRPSLKSN